MRTGGVYVTLTSPDGDRLVGVSSPASAKADLHSMQTDGTIMRMREISGGLVLPPGKPVTLSPAGNHIMLDGLKAPLKQGSMVPVRLLTFAKAPPVDIQAQVQSIGAATARQTASRHAGHEHVQMTQPNPKGAQSQ